MKLPISLAAILALFAVLVLGFGSTSSSSAINDENAVAYWSGIAQDRISGPPLPPPSTALRPPASSTVLAAMVHGAMYDAVAAFDGALSPFVADLTPAPDASVEAAVAKAARDVLSARLPSHQQVLVVSAYTTYITYLTDDLGIDPADIAAGEVTGTAAAAAMLVFRDGDGFGAPAPYTPPTAHTPGVFEPIAQGVVTPFANAPSATPTPVDKMLAGVRPFTYDNPWDYRPAAPYAITSKRYTQDLAEVQAVGRTTNHTNFADPKTDTARFYSDPTYRQYSRAVIRLVNERGLDLRESARLLGYTWVAVADTMIACWEAKYKYLFWRPNHAIQWADTDNNPATAPEDGWLPFLTGNHPEYPSGHACFTAGMATSLHRYFGTKNVPLTMTSAVTGGSRTYPRLDDLVEDVENARVWGGLHYRTTMTETAKHFPRIARHVGAHNFLKGLED